MYICRAHIIILAVLSSLAVFSNLLVAQTPSAPNTTVDSFWGPIEARLEKSDVNAFISRLVSKHCGKDYTCLYENYEEILWELELRNKYWIAVPVAEEMVTLAKTQADLRAEANALSRLIALYGFIENRELESQQYQELLQLYERLGDIPAIIKTKAIILEGRAWYLGEVAEILPALEALVAQAEKQGFTETANSIRVRLKYLYGDFGYVDKLAETVEALEKIPVSNPIKPAEAPYALHAASGRADLLMLEKKYDKAAALYHRALAVTRLRHRAQHDSWSEVYMLQRLATLEWERGDSPKAQSYLDTAYTVASKATLYDRLTLVLQMQAQIAETEKRFADALRYTREIHKHEATLDSLAAGTDVQRYQLQLAKEQLTIEKEKQALEINLKNSQLRSFTVIVMLIVSLTAGLFIGFFKQRQGKLKLTAQNALIQEQAEQLKNLDTAKTRFFANISHELRTPLTLMLGPVRTLLKEGSLSLKQSHLLQMADRSGKQLQQLINEILELRKLEMGKMELHKQPTQLAAFFRRYFAQFESLAERKGIDFSFVIQLDSKVCAEIDQEKCRQVLYNLLANAFKFTPDGGRIEANVSVTDEILKLSVTDSGPGIHPDDLPHVFDRFFQANRPESPVEGGTGIGLALCNEHVKLFGGDITVESTLGKGTIFRVAIPVSFVEYVAGFGQHEEEIAASLQVPQAMPVSEQPTEKPTILIVEDNIELQGYLRLVLADTYRVLIADHGQAALNKLHKNPTCELILSDLMMPVMDGYQLLEKLKASDATRHIPVIMLTARADLRDKLKALRIGVDDYLVKPFDEEELVVRIAHLLKNHTARRTAIATEGTPDQAAPLLSEEDRLWLEQFETFVQANLAKDILSVSLLAEAFAMSKSTLLRQLKRLTGLTPVQYLQEMRLDTARQLLENQTYNSIAKVAYEVGYADTRSFSRTFKSRFGKLPSDFLDDHL